MPIIPNDTANELKNKYEATLPTLIDYLSLFCRIQTNMTTWKALITSFKIEIIGNHLSLLLQQDSATEHHRKTYFFPIFPPESDKQKPCKTIFSVAGNWDLKLATLTAFIHFFYTSWHACTRCTRAIFSFFSLASSNRILPRFYFYTNLHDCNVVTLQIS